MVKGALAGFMIADPNWRIEDVASILEKFPENTNPIPPLMLEDDENFMIEKE